LVQSHAIPELSESQRWREVADDPHSASLILPAALTVTGCSDGSSISSSHGRSLGNARSRVRYCEWAGECLSALRKCKVPLATLARSRTESPRT